MNEKLKNWTIGLGSVGLVWFAGMKGCQSIGEEVYHTNVNGHEVRYEEGRARLLFGPDFAEGEPHPHTFNRMTVRSGDTRYTFIDNLADTHIFGDFDGREFRSDWLDKVIVEDPAGKRVYRVEDSIGDTLSERHINKVMHRATWLYNDLRTYIAEQIEKESSTVENFPIVNGFESVRREDE
jgi:hypothetical protein